MSGEYVLHCSCAAELTIPEYETRRPEEIESAMAAMPVLEQLSSRGWPVRSLPGTEVGVKPLWYTIGFLLDHWRHGQVSYTYSNNSDPPVILKPPPEAGLSAPCGTCQGRRLIPCPDC